jgi:hypothetical protein
MIGDDRSTPRGVTHLTPLLAHPDWRGVVDYGLLAAIDGCASRPLDERRLVAGHALALWHTPPSSSAERMLLSHVLREHVGILDGLPEFGMSCEAAPDASSSLFVAGRAQFFGLSGLPDAELERVAQLVCIALHEGELIEASDGLICLLTSACIPNPDLNRFLSQAIDYLTVMGDCFPMSQLLLSIHIIHRAATRNR